MLIDTVSRATLMAGAVIVALSSLSVYAATVTTDTITRQRDVPGTQKVNFADFDVNHDGQLSRTEVGEKLFYIFDTDGNEVIDNIEYQRIMVLSIIPMQRQEITRVDFNDDGIADNTSFNQQDFIQQSLLYKFDVNKNGLSARDFLGQVYWQLDDNNDKTVDVKEWEEAYIASLRPSAANPNQYNH